MRLVRLLHVLWLAAMLAGCVTMRAPAPGVAAVAAPADLDGILYARPGYVLPEGAPLPVPAAVLPGPAPGGDQPYCLDSGDKLRIVVFGQDGLSSTYIVDAAGKITMPLIGVVSARNLTTTQLAKVIADRLRNGFVREPHVAIEVETYRPFFILGEVTAPGLYPYVPNITVETAIAIAGGFSPRAYRYDVTISRSSAGVTARQKVPLIAPVRPGDTVTVSERWF